MVDYHDRRSFNLHVLRSKVVNWKRGDEANEYSERAVDFLIKKLKNSDGKISLFFCNLNFSLGVLDSLAKVLLNPHSPSPCITIPRSVDKRIQIKYQKEFPHVVYCRLWRFADLQNYHELVPTFQCRYPFSPGNNRNQQHVCINPYHYNRVPSQGKNLNKKIFNKKIFLVLPSIIEPRINNENSPPTPPLSMYSPDPCKYFLFF